MQALHCPGTFPAGYMRQSLCMPGRQVINQRQHADFMVPAPSAAHQVVHTWSRAHVWAAAQGWRSALPRSPPTWSEPGVCQVCMRSLLSRCALSDPAQLSSFARCAWPAAGGMYNCHAATKHAGRCVSCVVCQRRPVVCIFICFVARACVYLSMFVSLTFRPQRCKNTVTAASMLLDSHSTLNYKDIPLSLTVARS